MFFLPSWTWHIRQAKKKGYDPEIAQKINKMLDYPSIVGIRVPHRSLHNEIGLALAYLTYGKEGFKIALDHLYHDLIQTQAKHLKRQLKKTRSEIPIETSKNWLILNLLKYILIKELLKS